MNGTQGHKGAARGMLPTLRNSFKWCRIHKNTESLCCTPKTNIAL